MKYSRKGSLFFLIGLIILGLSSCKEDDNVVEEAGLSVYQIDNQSTKTLILKSSSKILIHPNDIKKIGEDGGIGVKPPLPSTGIGLLKLYRNENGTEIVAFERAPVIDSEWTEKKQNSKKKYGLVYYTMIITDKMIK